MRGKVLLAAKQGQAGLISGDDGARYTFHLTDVAGGAPAEGRDVDFQVSGSEARGIFAIGGQANNGGAIKSRNWVEFYMSPSGRISRREYWLLGFLPIMGVSLVLGWIPIIGQILGLITTWSLSIALAFKRFHDRGMSGWWTMLPSVPGIIGLVMVISAFFSSSYGPDQGVLGAGVTLMVIAFLIQIGFLIGVFCQRGVEGPNVYGPDPLAGE